MQDDKQFIQAYSSGKAIRSSENQIYVNSNCVFDILNQPFIYIGKMKLQDELQGEVIAQLPNASVMYQFVIDKPSTTYIFTLLNTIN